MNAFKGVGALVFGLAVMAGFWWLLGWFVQEGVTVAVWLLPWLSHATTVTLAVCVLILVPLAIFRKTRPVSAIGLMIASYVFGATLWFYGLLMAYAGWGLVGIIVGLVLAGVGVVPVAALAALIHGEWAVVGQIAVGLVLTFGVRFLSMWLTSRSESTRFVPPYPSLAAKISRVIGTSWLVLAVVATTLGYGSILYFHGWSELQEIASPFNLWNDIMLLVTLAPGALLLKLSDWLERRKIHAGVARQFATCVALLVALSSPALADKKAEGVLRDDRGRIERSSSEKAEFKKEQPCPSTDKASGACPGYVVDHVKPLCKGGADKPWNMQWQTVAEGKAKDRVECR